MGKPKRATGVMTALKKELEAENPEQVLEKVQELKAQTRGTAALMLYLDYSTMSYNRAYYGAEGLEELKLLRDAVAHFLQEDLGEQIKRLEVEAEVQRRLKEAED